MNLRATFLETWRALLSPRRLLVVALLAGPLLLMQREFSASLGAVWLAVATLVVFLLVAPAAYRWLFALEQPRKNWPLRFLAYVLLGGLAPLLAAYGPGWLGVRWSFVSSTPTIFITAALFWVGGYGLGRDIDLELRFWAAQKRAAALAKEAERAELLAMRAQLDPHFLFNTLNAIAEWCREDPLVAERALLDLSALLRQVLHGIRQPAWPLQVEIQLVLQLWELHRIRDPGRFTITSQVDPTCASFLVPPLILLPLAENAMTHGPAKGHRGEVSLQVQPYEGGVQIRLTNPGQFKGRRTGGEGLQTVERRLALAFEGARLTIEGAPVQATLRISKVMEV